MKYKFMHRMYPQMSDKYITLANESTVARDKQFETAKEGLLQFLDDVVKKVLEVGKYHKYEPQMTMDQINMYLRVPIRDFLKNNKNSIKILFVTKWFSKNVTISVKNKDTSEYRQRLLGYYTFMTTDGKEGTRPPEYVDKQNADFLCRNIEIIFGSRPTVAKTINNGFTVVLLQNK